MNVLICGHIDITEEQFNKYYIPDIEELLKTYPKYIPTFYIGGANGTDSFAQDYIHKLGHKMVICDKGDQDNVKYPGEKTEHINGFKTYETRDKSMVSKCIAMVLFLRNEPKSLGSGSMRNFLSKVLDTEKADLFMRHARSKEWNSVEECLNEFDMSDKIKEQIGQILVL